MKYRVVKKDGKYYIQKRILGFMWVYHKETVMYETDYNSLGVNSLHTGLHPWAVIYYKSKEDADKDIEQLKKFPIWYKGHKITTVLERHSGRTIYVDRTTRVGYNDPDDLFGIFCYPVYSYNIGDVKDMIDADIEARKERRKRLFTRPEVCK